MYSHQKKIKYVWIAVSLVAVASMVAYLLLPLFYYL